MRWHCRSAQGMCQSAARSRRDSCQSISQRPHPSCMHTMNDTIQSQRSSSRGVQCAFLCTLASAFADIGPILCAYTYLSRMAMIFRSQMRIQCTSRTCFESRLYHSISLLPGNFSISASATFLPRVELDINVHDHFSVGHAVH